ncbi:MAG: hypothetical protein HXY20_11710 [Acidobacteria bacterium]|nr:hypothetical protein [Acidobacteriota bacterium]
MRITRLLWTAAAGISLSVPALAKEEKMKPEELVAKHVASIGSAAALSAAANRSITGTTQLIFRLGGHGQLKGPTRIVSEGRKIYLGMMFAALDYRSDQFSFDGSKVEVSQLAPGRRSQIGMIVYQNDFFLKEGLLGGAMTTAWALLDVAGRQPKLNYAGLKKMEGRQLHELRYRARKGAGDFQIALYFEPETFRHIYTTYRLVIPESMAARPEASAGQQRTIVSLREGFSDFAPVDGLTLPFSYKLVLTIEGQGGSSITEWDFHADRILHSRELEPGAFAIR